MKFQASKFCSGGVYHTFYRSDVRVKFYSKLDVNNKQTCALKEDHELEEQ